MDGTYCILYTDKSSKTCYDIQQCNNYQSISAKLCINELWAERRDDEKSNASNAEGQSKLPNSSMTNVKAEVFFNIENKCTFEFYKGK